MACVGLGDAGGIDEDIQTFSLDGIGDDQNDGTVFGSSVRNGLCNGDGIAHGNGYGIDEVCEVGRLVILGSLLGLDNSIRDGTAVVGSLVGAGVGKDDGMRPASVEGKDEGLDVGMVECSLFGLGDGFFVCLGNQLGNNVGWGFGTDVFGKSVAFGLGMLNAIERSEEVGVRSKGLGVGARTESNFAE